MVREMKNIRRGPKIWRLLEHFWEREWSGDSDFRFMSGGWGSVRYSGSIIIFNIITTQTIRL